MDYIYSTILGLVQGITEFLPISSTGHLIILHKLIPSPLLDNLTFDVFLHFGTLIALAAFFWKDIVNLAKDFFLFVFYRKQTTADCSWRLIIVGILPALIAGYFLENLIEQKFRSPFIVALMLVIGGILFIIYEKISSHNKNLITLSFADAVIIGTFQIFAFLPGMSRSGITMVGGMARGLTRKDAARFSFFMAMPLIFLATIKRITQISLSDSSFNFVFVCILGAAVAALIGYFSIKYLLRFLEKQSLFSFAIYRFVLALLVLLFI